MSEQTGFSRSYDSNRYAGYDESEGFFFAPSRTDERYPAKEIFVAFSVGDTHVAAPWLQLADGRSYQTAVNDQEITLAKTDGELRILGPDNTEIPFYFEMWFSRAIQNEDGQVFDPHDP